MHEVERPPIIENAVLVAVELPIDDSHKVQEHLDELGQLAWTAGADVFKKFIQKRKAYDPAFFVGEGFIEEVKNFADEKGCEVIIFDDELSSAQLRNIEQKTEKKVIDRTGLILDIFAMHARTNVAKMQVELAQMQYILPRLSGRGKSFMQQTGGIGTRGPGETKLEIDRRRVNKRISDLTKRLKEVEEARKEQRKKRRKEYKISIVGYTNAGKSSLINLLTHADVLVEDKLFATLDSTTRKLHLPDNSNVLISDTVGFIRKLPHSIVESFKTTLEVVAEADLIIKVHDLSNPSFQDHIENVNLILDEIGIHDKQIINVFNKIDNLHKDSLVMYSQIYENGIFVSVKNSEGIEQLLEKIIEYKDKLFVSLELECNDANIGALEKVRDKLDVIDYAKSQIGEPVVFIKYRADFDEYIKGVIGFGEK